MYINEKALGYVFCDSDVVLENQKLTLKKIVIGDLYFESGQIIANDPFAAFPLDPLTVAVPSGSYTVSIIVAEKEPQPLPIQPEPTGLKKFFSLFAGNKPAKKTEPDNRIALSCLKFSDNNVVKWEAAKTGKEADDTEYGVKSGMGGFMDKEVADKLLASLETLESDLYHKNYVLDKWTLVNGEAYDPLDDENPEPAYRLMDITNGGRDDFVLYTSEWSQEAFPSYFGLDETGAPCVLVTDFMVLEG